MTAQPVGVQQTWLPELFRPSTKMPVHVGAAAQGHKQVQAFDQDAGALLRAPGESVLPSCSESVLLSCSICNRAI